MPNFQANAEFERLAYVTGTASPFGGAGDEKANIALAAKNMNGMPLPGATISVRLSDSTAGVGLTATTPSSIGIGSRGEIIEVLVAAKAVTVTADDAGMADIIITDPGKTPFVVVALVDGLPRVVLTLTEASYS